METHLPKGMFPFENFENAKCDLACQSAPSALLGQLGGYAMEIAQSERTQSPTMLTVGRSQIQTSESKLRPSVAKNVHVQP